MTDTPHPHRDLVCDICYLNYNRTLRQPLLLCSRSHLVCAQCIRHIRKKKQCPFCRTPLDLSRIRIDYSTLKQLPPDPLVPNSRIQKEQPEYFQLTPEPSVSEEDSDVMQEGLLLEMQENWQLQRLYLTEEVKRKRALILIATLFFLLPFGALDIYFGIFYQGQPNCTNQRIFTRAVTLSQWFSFIGGVEVLYLLFYLAGQLKRKCGTQYQALYLNSIEEIYSMGLAVKALFCCTIEVPIFFEVAIGHCGGSIYGYCLALCCFHITKMVMIALSLFRNWCC